MDIDDLRNALAEKADTFSMSERPPRRVVADARKRFVVSFARGTTVLSLLLAGGLFVLARQDANPPPEDSTKTPVAIELVDDYVDDDGERDGQDHPASWDEVRAHVQCMRDAGFDLPDATRTSHGWEIEVDDPEAMGIDSPAWREAAFVTCRPTSPPGHGNLVFGVPLSAEEIQAFEDCMAQEGFSLPEPTPMDEPGWEFDLSESDIDFDSESWHRAVFLTCWPDAAP